METPRRRSESDLVAIGRVAKTHGRHGEVAVNLLTDFPERFMDLVRVFAVDRMGESRRLDVDAARFHKGRPILKLRGIESIGDAKPLAGLELSIPASELKQLPAGTFYHFEIVGLSVTDAEQGHIGTAVDVLPTGGTDVLVVRGRDGEEHLLPLCSEICRRIDLDAGCIEVDAPEGLLSLNAN